MQVPQHFFSNSIMDAPLPSPPLVDVDGIANFRDIGGYATSNAQTVRRGLVYRSADPSKATPAGLEKMSKALMQVDKDQLPENA